ncbi:MAG: MFS transporter [Acinetobacter sp.]|nr:MFS transporter [Acinetobacter sp.]
MSQSQSKKSWQAAFQSYLDRRALIMLFLGFAAGIPIFLIFSTLSFWLTEAGINRSTITMFSLAGLGYSFKFIWSPLVDKLPIPFLTKRMGQRRSWMLIAQLMVVLALVLMAMTDPSADAAYFTSVKNITLMAMAAVFLGFSSATQDIVIDAYRIELSQDSDVQTVLASTYNAGYRIANIMTQMGALLFAAALGTAVGNYIYEAWQMTYLLMAALMFVGIITTFCISEPQVERSNNHYQKKDYLQLISVFVLSTIAFAVVFSFGGDALALLKVKDPFMSFLLVVVQFAVALVAAILAVIALIKSGLINRTIVVETWVKPLADFFKRYGLSVALAILLLIGFYRISDIVAGAIANLFYVDLNFDKEEIAWFNKFFAVAFVILGGFLGGILAQRYNVMKMMLVGAILASTTNLIFVGLVKSGASMNDVQLQVGAEKMTLTPDEVGNWSVKLRPEQLKNVQSLHIQSQPDGQALLQSEIALTHYQAGDAASVYVEAISGDNYLYKNQLERDVIIKGSLLNLPKDAEVKQVVLKVANQADVITKVDDKRRWNGVIAGKNLAQATQFGVQVDYVLQGQNLQLNHVHSYKTQLDQAQPEYRMSMTTLPAINADEQQEIELKGKVVVPYSKVWLVLGIIFDNLASGLAGAVFIAFLSSLTSVSFTAMQYALFTSLMLLLPKTIGAYSGTIVNNMGYSGFFSLTFFMGIPIFFIVLWVERLLSRQKQE